MGLSLAALGQVGKPSADAGSVPTGSSASAAPTTERLTAVYLGDSYTAGAGSTKPSEMFATVVSAREQWTTVNLGRGGTGYGATAGKEACGLDYCPTYREMIPEAVAADPDVVIVSGGRNDRDVDAALLEQVEATYADLRSALPDARIVATSPLWDDDPTVPADFDRLGDTIRAAAERAGGVYLDIGQPLLGHPELLSPDGVHPNDAGHRAIGESIDAALPAQ
ncbi:SGNH/GDSL hydrolase family protein [Clavibacter zhangzhiyongii]|uniref:SGNH/GDSL hydrolase family protein n=1 Tax=Clavibacter zhangzhiyongii TaxID=2768071 RepID=A0A7L7Z128_9MICO|nr:SGNH/GDSL hydrolase family protein [Clavibacter zhangzhiyongii]QOD43399.1 SGNH/GDSL hydrolase family protein [Clavibacter zhangzhiyongii]